ncbi:MAG: efflux RND transporter periplasmic adaptor subunit [Desulfococcaceae bacterium]
MKRFTAVILCLACLVIAVPFFAQEEKKPEPKPEEKKEKMLPVVMVEKAVPGAVSEILELTGSVVPTRIARVASPVEGPVQNCSIREGDSVKRGQKLLYIGRDTSAYASLTAAKAGLKEQEQELKRTQQLVKSGAIPGAQLDTARSRYENAKAQVAKARESADDYSVTAPWDGIISRVFVRDGDYVAPRAPLVEIFDPASLVIQFAVPEAKSVAIQEDMLIQAGLDAYAGKIFEGKISRAYPELDAKMRTRTVEAVLDEAPNLIPGMFARIKVILKHIPDAISVPADALIVSPKGDHFVAVAEEGKVKRRKVETGIEEAGRIQIIKGIAPGDLVIVSGGEKLKDDTEVQINGGSGK